MKTINYHGREFQYEIFSDCNEYDGLTYETEFYEGTEMVTKRKYWLFGPKITVEQPKLIFKLYIDIEDETYTKQDIRDKIRRKVELLNRKLEIEKGEII
jgi:hypothetical protein